MKTTINPHNGLMRISTLERRHHFRFPEQEGIFQKVNDTSNGVEYVVVDGNHYNPYLSCRNGTMVIPVRIVEIIAEEL